MISDQDSFADFGLNECVAACISGLSRQWSACVDSVAERVLNYPHIAFAVTDEPLEYKINRALYFKQQDFLYATKWNKFSCNKAPETHVLNFLNQWYRIYKCNQLKNDFEKEVGSNFAVVVRIRPDVVFNSNIDLFSPPAGVMVVSRDHSWGGVCDQFWFSDSITSNIISELYLRIPEYIEKGCRFHPETLLDYHCKQVGIIRIEQDFDFFIKR
jgi:hypothetical protein